MNVLFSLVYLVISFFSSCFQIKKNKKNVARPMKNGLWKKYKWFYLVGMKLINVCWSIVKRLDAWSEITMRGKKW